MEGSSMRDKEELDTEYRLLFLMCAVGVLIVMCVDYVSAYMAIS